MTSLRKTSRICDGDLQTTEVRTCTKFKLLIKNISLMVEFERCIYSIFLSKVN